MNSTAPKSPPAENRNMSLSVATTRTHRQRARAVIAPVIAAHYGQPRKAVRKALREAFANYATSRTGRAYQVWLEEVRYAMRERTRKPNTRQPARPLAAADIMPSMRDWAAAQGITQPIATYDTHLPL